MSEIIVTSVADMNLFKRGFFITESFAQSSHKMIHLFSLHNSCSVIFFSFLCGLYRQGQVFRVILSIAVAFSIPYEDLKAFYKHYLITTPLR